MKFPGIAGSAPRRTQFRSLTVYLYDSTHERHVPYVHTRAHAGSACSFVQRRFHASPCAHNTPRIYDYSVSHSLPTTTAFRRVNSYPPPHKMAGITVGGGGLGGSASCEICPVCFPGGCCKVQKRNLLSDLSYPEESI